MSRLLRITAEGIEKLVSSFTAQTVRRNGEVGGSVLGNTSAKHRELKNRLPQLR
jgi:hypothetical protein